MKTKLRRIRDNWLSAFIGCLLSVIYLVFFRTEPLPNSLDNLFLGGIAIFSALASFLLAAQAIIFSLDEKNIIKQLKITNTYRKLILCFVHAIRWSFASLVVCMLGLYIDFETHHKWHNFFFASWILVLVTSLCTCYRVVDVLSKISMSQSNSEP